MICPRVALAVLVVGVLAAGQTEVLRINGHPSSYLGLRLFDAGDLNQDGVGDVVSISDLDSCPAPALGLCGSDAGSVRAYSGRDGRLLWTVSGQQYDRLGRVASQIEDADGDGIRDYAVGDRPLLSPFFPPTEDFHYGVISGATGLWLHRQTVTFPTGGIALAQPTAMGNVGDINNDGRGDYAYVVFAVEPLSGGGYDYPNYLDIYDGLSGVRLRRHVSQWFNSFAEHTPVGVEDVNQDGYRDYVAWYGNLQLSPLTGVVYSGLDGASLRTFPLPPGTPAFNVETTDDIDGLGMKDVIMADVYFGCPGLGGFCGNIKCISLESGTVIWSADGAPSESFGRDIATIVDMNQDGFRDVLEISAGPATAKILSGVDGVLIQSVSGLATSAVCSVEDITGDGIADFATSNQIIGGAISRSISLYASRSVSSPSALSLIPGCGVIGSLELAADAPLMGTTVGVRMSGIPAGLSGGVWASLLPPGPTDLGGGCMLGLDPATILPLGAFLAPAAGQHSYLYALPQIPLSAGLEIALQGAIWPTAAPRGFDISNSLKLRLGY